jgi:hypothetical protein
MPTGQPAPRSATSRPVLLSQLVGTPSCDADRVLLGCFGLHLGGTRSRHDLCTALRQAGYPGALARHVVRTSPLLIDVPPPRRRGQRYRLRRCTEYSSPPTRARHRAPSRVGRWAPGAARCGHPMGRAWRRRRGHSVTRYSLTAWQAISDASCTMSRVLVSTAQLHDRSTRTTASVGSRSAGSGTSSTHPHVTGAWSRLHARSRSFSGERCPTLGRGRTADGRRCGPRRRRWCCSHAGR